MTCSLDIHYYSVENISADHSFSQRLISKIHNRDIDREVRA